MRTRFSNMWRTYKTLLMQLVIETQKLHAFVKLHCCGVGMNCLSNGRLQRLYLSRCRNDSLVGKVNTLYKFFIEIKMLVVIISHLAFIFIFGFVEITYRNQGNLWDIKSCMWIYFMSFNGKGVTSHTRENKSDREATRTCNHNRTDQNQVCIQVEKGSIMRKSLDGYTPAKWFLVKVKSLYYLYH